MLQSNNCEQDLILHIFTCGLSIIFLTFDQKVNKWFQGLEINTLDVETFADRNFRGWLGLIFFADINFRGRPISKYFACINFRGSTINWKNFPNFRQFCSQILSTYFVKKNIWKGKLWNNFFLQGQKISRMTNFEKFRGWPDLIFFAEEAFADLGWIREIRESFYV